jgi:hypothetical protein
MPYYSDNAVRFFQSDALYDDNGAYLDAQLPVQSASYTIQIYDSSTNPETFIKGITNSTSDGMIQEDWNLTYDDGVTVFTGNNFDAVFSVTLSDSGSGPVPQIPPTPKKRKKGHTKFLTTEQGNGFNFTYFYTPRGSYFADEFGSPDDGLAAVWIGMQNVVDTLLTPDSTGNETLAPNYDSSFNNYTGEGNNYHGNGTSEGWPGYVTSQSTIDSALLPSMGNGETKNFFAYAHGEGDSLGSYTYDVTLFAADVAGALTNFYSSKQIISVKNPYRFVFLDGCGTASTLEWPKAFGIFPLWETNDAPAARYKLGAQAYVGWAKPVTGWLNPTSDTEESENVAFSYTETLDEMYELWMGGLPLAQCLDAVSSRSSGLAAFPVPVAGNLPYQIYSDDGISGPYNYTIPASNIITSPIYIIGHSGLTRTGVNTGIDTNPAYNKYHSPLDHP